MTVIVLGVIEDPHKPGSREWLDDVKEWCNKPKLAMLRSGLCRSLLKEFQTVGPTVSPFLLH